MSDQIQMFIQGLGNMMSQIETLNAEERFPKPEITVDDPLEHQLIDILMENTGCDILDSGGAYGRAWQRNRQIKDWNLLPEIEVHAWADNDWYCTVPIYHFLKAFLEITEESKRYQKLFDEFSSSEEFKDKYWPECMEGFAEKLGCRYNRVGNTYNYDNLLDHGLQYIIIGDYHDPLDFDLEQPLILLQVHLGCDIRGGYTSPYVFSLPESDYFHLAMGDLDAWCPRCGMCWYTDDSGYHWYYDHCDSNIQSLDGTRDEELKTFVDEEQVVRHKNCGGELQFTPHLWY